MPLYRPLLQTYSTDAMTLHVRASNDPGELAGAIRAEVQHIDRQLSLYQVSTLEDQLDGAYAQTRQAALLTGVFGAGMSTVLVLVSLIAFSIPVRTATRLDAVAAIRHDS